MMNVKLKEQADLVVRVHNMSDEEKVKLQLLKNYTTRMKMVNINTCEAVYECEKCGRRESIYCHDPDWNYCRKCGRVITKIYDPLKESENNGNGSVNQTDSYA